MKLRLRNLNLNLVLYCQKSSLLCKFKQEAVVLSQPDNYSKHIKIFHEGNNPNFSSQDHNRVIIINQITGRSGQAGQYFRKPIQNISKLFQIIVKQAGNHSYQVTYDMSGFRQHIIHIQHLAHSTNPFGLLYPKFSNPNTFHILGLTYPRFNQNISKSYITFLKHL